MNNTKQPLARKEGLIVQELPDEVLVYDAANDKAHCLNETAALVWKHCDGKTNVAEIAKIVGRELNASVKDEFVWLALDQLEKEALIEKEANFSLKTFGISRREVIKRIGLASVIALPIVTSLLNPMSAQAGTCTVPCTPASIPGLCGTPTAPTVNCQSICTSLNVCAPVAVPRIESKGAKKNRLGS
ncbi:MAG: PqqD family protein [Pyrinomonadaceae bacterium]